MLQKCPTSSLFPSFCFCLLCVKTAVQVVMHCMYVGGAVREDGMYVNNSATIAAALTIVP